jgi:hypothetical protein
MQHGRNPPAVLRSVALTECCGFRGYPFVLFAHLAAPATGTLIAASGLSCLSVGLRRPGQTGSNRMAIKIAVLAVSAFIAAPAVAGFATSGQQAPARIERTVALAGPILSFTQTRNRIQLRLDRAPQSKTSRTVVIATPDGESALTLPLHPGQTWLSAKLTEPLATADQLAVTVR